MIIHDLMIKTMWLEQSTCKRKNGHAHDTNVISIKAGIALTTYLHG